MQQRPVQQRHEYGCDVSAFAVIWGLRCEVGA